MSGYMRYHRFVYSDALRGGKTSPHYELVVLSATSFCGFCQQMAETKKALQEELKDINVTLDYIDDEENKDKFQSTKLKLQEKGATISGFPHSTLLVDGKFLADFSGLKTPEEMKEVVENAIGKIEK